MQWHNVENQRWNWNHDQCTDNATIRKEHHPADRGVWEWKRKRLGGWGTLQFRWVVVEDQIWTRKVSPCQKTWDYTRVGDRVIRNCAIFWQTALSYVCGTEKNEGKIINRTRTSGKVETNDTTRTAQFAENRDNKMRNTEKVISWNFSITRRTSILITGRHEQERKRIWTEQLEADTTQQHQIRMVRRTSDNRGIQAVMKHSWTELVRWGWTNWRV